MGKTILLTIVSVLILGLLVSCASGVSQELFKKTSDGLAAAQTQIQSLQANLNTMQGDLTKAQAQVQSLQKELDAAQAQLKDKTTELYVNRTQLTDAQTKIQSYQNVFPLKDFKSLSELQGFLNFNAKGWQLDILKMQEDKRFSSVNFARALQAAANKAGYTISVQIDKAAGTAFNTAFIDNITYAIEPQYTIAPGGMATNTVWVYTQSK